MLKNSKRKSYTGKRLLRLLTQSSKFGLKCKRTGKDLNQFSWLQKISELNYQMIPRDSKRSILNGKI